MKSGLIYSLICLGILLWGFFEMDENFKIHLSMMKILEAGLTSAAVLISFGAVLGKLNPFQTLIMALIESTVFVANAFLGYKVLGTLDVGGAIFIHAFGAYFGITVALVLRRKNYSLSEKLEESVYHSDLFAMVSRSCSFTQDYFFTFLRLELYSCGYSGQVSMPSLPTMMHTTEPS